MELVQFTEFLVKSLVKDPDMVAVKSLEEEDGTILLEVVVGEEDMGSVIGRSGKIANAIRTLVQASAYINGNQRVKINIDSI